MALIKPTNNAESMYRSVLLAAAFFLLLDLTVLVLNFSLASQLASSAQQINLVGRQRMLCQRIAKDLLNLQLNPTPLAMEQLWPSLQDSQQLFDSTLNALMVGGGVTNGDGKRVTLAPIQGAQAQQLLKQTQHLWQPLASTLTLAAQHKDNPVLLAQAFRLSQQHNLSLLLLMNELTSQVETASYQRVKFIRMLQTGAIILAILNFAFILRYLLLRTKGYAERLEQSLSELADKNKQLELAKQAAEGANTARAQFMANISHEIRTPLNGMIGTLELLGQQVQPLKERELVAVAHQSAHSLLALLNDVLDFSKIDAGRLHLEKIPFDMPAMLTETIAVLAPIAKAKNVKLDFQMDSRLPKKVIGDPLRIKQILLNLVSNGIKFSAGHSQEQATVTLRVVVDVLNVNDVSVLFVVADNGIGIEPEALGRIFQPFRQAENSITRRYGGTGLGLAICQELVALMGGCLQVKSVVNQGSEFSCLLKLAYISSVELVSTNPLASRQAPNLSPTQATDKLILVAEDNPINRKLIQQQLAWLGYRCILAENGVQALTLLAEYRPALLLTDCHMPEMDGYTLATQIRHHEQQYAQQPLPIIAFTASALPSEAEKCLSLGMNDLLLKPVELAGLQAMLRKWLPD
ncbi:ATP-binding protein [Agitococcus lubricus]|uniref:histidine kinase n=1 Tax=Agitococcus lubricus TaxID=1077255 RepID=A0A2T5J046_9GAMM|nr:ATP-binding protein [Agitococcus lubricus]PTQ89604.1 signal transduction histidine kinase [Agitococcus lubricus]